MIDRRSFDGDEVDHGDGDQDHASPGRRPAAIRACGSLGEIQPDAAGADDADDGRGARVELEIVEHLARDQREDLAGGGRSGSAAAASRRPRRRLRSPCGQSLRSPRRRACRRSRSPTRRWRATPAKGPSPTTLTHISAQISTSIERMTSKTRRTAKWTKLLGDHVLRGEKRQRETPAVAATSVPRKAMATVSPSA